MAGLDKHTPLPTRIVLHQQSRVLEIAFDDGQSFRLPFELLRVYSPSAEVRGHGPGQETLQVGKRDVRIDALEPVGHYALQPRFSDGHDSGIYSWDYLHELGREQTRRWRDYEARLRAAGASRDPAEPAVPSAALPGVTMLRRSGPSADQKGPTVADVPPKMSETCQNADGTTRDTDAGTALPSRDASSDPQDETTGFRSVSVRRPR